jgi:electron transfer flavoprotein alpha subunit
MASIVAYIEVREGDLTPSSLFAVGESRRIAQAVGATVYAFLPVGPIAHAEIDRLAEQLSAAGADRLLCSSDATLAGPALDVTHGAVLAQMADHLRPLLFLFPAGGPGTELGAPLAIRIGAAYVPAASVEIQRLERSTEPESHRVLVTRWRAAGDSLRRIDVGDLERPVVAVLQAGAAMDALGESYAEVEMIPCPTAKAPEVRLVRADADPGAQIETCATLVCVPAGTSAVDLEALRAALPAEACVRTEEAGELIRAAPANLLLLSVDHRRLPFRGGSVVSVSGTPAELATALRGLRASNVETDT